MSTHLRCKSMRWNWAYSDPFSKLEINGKSLQRFVFISSRKHCCKMMTMFQALQLVFSGAVYRMLKICELDVRYPSNRLVGTQTVKRITRNLTLMYNERLRKNQKPYYWLVVTVWVRFSPVVSLRYMANSHGTDSTIAHKLARVARIHYVKSFCSIRSQPAKPLHCSTRLLKSEAIKKAIEDEAEAKIFP